MYINLSVMEEDHDVNPVNNMFQMQIHDTDMLNFNC